MKSGLAEGATEAAVTRPTDGTRAYVYPRAPLGQSGILLCTRTPRSFGAPYGTAALLLARPSCVSAPGSGGGSEEARWICGARSLLLSLRALPQYDDDEKSCRPSSCSGKGIVVARWRAHSPGGCGAVG